MQPTLTARQGQVFAAYCEAGSAKVAAHRLGLSVSAVKRHVSNVHAACGVSTSLQAAIVLGWLDTRRSA